MHDVYDYDRLRLIAHTMILKIIKNALRIHVRVSNFIGG